MRIEGDFYSILGSYYDGASDEKIERDITSKLFQTQNIYIKIHPIFLQKKKLKITSLEFKGDNLEIENTINEINLDIQRQGDNSKGYKCEEPNTWSVFYLLKELITALSSSNYNFYRGQGSNWATRPSIFRPLKLIGDIEDEINFYEDFEKLYQQVSREYPDNIKYIELEHDELIDERADELATLQHYGLPTSLLDVTENPFIALLFMLESDEFSNPQIEFYKFNPQKDADDSLLTFTHKKNNNKRIKAQKGAFINYDKINRFIKIDGKEWNLSDRYRKIDRILVEIILDLEGYKSYLDSLRLDSKELKKKEELLKIIKEEKDKFFPEEGGSATQEEIKKNKNEIFENLRQELMKKLNEFHYFQRDLYPDFNDYLVHLKKKYKPYSSQSSFTL